MNTYLEKQAFNSGSQEWYTPEQYIIAARKVMGAIDLDPASCATAQKWIKAGKYYGLDNGQNGLVLNWRGRAWLNGPFNQSALWVDKLLKEWDQSSLYAERLEEVIALFKFVPNYKWFARLKRHPMVICDHRVSFWQDYEAPGESSMDGAICFVYLGPPNKNKLFAQTFCQFGEYVTFTKIT